MGAKKLQGRTVVVVGGCRTPFLRSGTGYADLMAYELAAMAVSGLLQRYRVDASDVDRVILGTVLAEPRTTNLAREAALACGLPSSCPAFTVTAACASSNVAIQSGVEAIASGTADVVVAGGAETLSDVPIRFGREVRKRLIQSQKAKGVLDYVKLLQGLSLKDLAPDTPALAEFSTGLTMGQCAERLAKRVGLTREEQDRFALKSHQKAATATEAGLYRTQVVPARVPPSFAPIEADNGVRGDTTLEKLSSLAPAFDRAFGTVTAGNSSFLTDGAAACLLMSAEKAEELGRDAARPRRLDVPRRDGPARGAPPRARRLGARGPRRGGGPGGRGRCLGGPRGLRRPGPRLPEAPRRQGVLPGAPRPEGRRGKDRPEEGERLGRLARPRAPVRSHRRAPRDDVRRADGARGGGARRRDDVRGRRPRARDGAGAMRSLTLKRRGDGVAVLLFDTPKRPVNVLSQELLEEAGPLMEEILDDDEIVACVLASAKPDSFIAGADLDQVVGMTAKEAEAISRGAHEWLGRVEESRKPFVAAIHGAALGGGLEVALACHYRLATDHPRTVLALPEVMLGVLPAAGGTQRLPRLVGLQRALPMLLTGKRVRAAQAFRHGLVDALTSPGGLVETAAKAALGLAKGTLKPNRDKQPLTEKPLALPPLRAWALGKARDEVMKKTRGLYPAPLDILACVEKGLADGIEAGLEEEAGRFGELVGGEKAKNLIRLFEAMTALKKGPKGEAPRSVKRLGVLGAGLMGEGIAAVSLGLGPVVLKDVSEDGLARASKNLRKGLDRRLRSGGLTRLERDRQWYGLRPTTRTEDLAGCDLVVEAVFEDLALKRKVLAETEAVIRPDAVFASNTSALPIREIAAKAKRPERVVGMHYFSPVPKMPLLEVVVAERTASWAVATARAFGVAQGKTVIVVKDGPGFYTTRILGPFINEAVVLLDEGAAIPALDAALLDFGFPVGPVALLDEVGIDVAAHVSKDLGTGVRRPGRGPVGDVREALRRRLPRPEEREGVLPLPEGEAGGRPEGSRPRRLLVLRRREPKPDAGGGPRRPSRSPDGQRGGLVPLGGDRRLPPRRRRRGRPGPRVPALPRRALPSRRRHRRGDGRETDGRPRPGPRKTLPPGAAPPGDGALGEEVPPLNRERMRGGPKGPPRRPQRSSLNPIRIVTWNSATFPSWIRPRSSTTSNQSMCRTVFPASSTADFTASAKLTGEIPTISTFLYVPPMMSSSGRSL